MAIRRFRQGSDCSRGPSCPLLTTTKAEEEPGTALNRSLSGRGLSGLVLLRTSFATASGMAEPRKKSIHIDQQKPEDLEDAEHSAVTPSRFSRRPPTAEDEYFERQQLRKRSEPVSPRPLASRTQEPGAPSTRLGRWIEKIAARMTRKSWRP